MQAQPCFRASVLRCGRDFGFDTGPSWHAVAHAPGRHGSGAAHGPSIPPVRCLRVCRRKQDRLHRHRIAARHGSSQGRCFPSRPRLVRSPSERPHRVQAHAMSTSSLVWFLHSRAQDRTRAFDATPSRPAHPSGRLWQSMSPLPSGSVHRSGHTCCSCLWR